MTYRNIIQGLLLSPVFLFVSSNRSAAQSSAHGAKWAVEKNSSLGIDGKSNVNSFTCSVNMHAERDTVIFMNDASKPVSLTGDLQIDVLGFDCHSDRITNDLRKTLKSDQYPRMTIRFLSLQSMPVHLNKTELVKGLVEVELAGVVKRFELNYSFSKVSAGYIILNGSRSFSFADFKLSPPQKLGGLIKIKDAFDVNFQLILRAV